MNFLTPGRFAVIDTETTSQYPDEARLIQVAVVTVDDWQITGRWATLVDPGLRWVGGVAVHGLTAADLAGHPSFGQVAGELSARCAGRMVVAHHLAYDEQVLAGEFDRIGQGWVPEGRCCTLQLTRALLPELPRKKLAYVAAELGVGLARAHDALSDAECCARVLIELRRRFGDEALLDAMGEVTVEAA